MLIRLMLAVIVFHSVLSTAFSGAPQLTKKNKKQLFCKGETVLLCLAR